MGQNNRNFGKSKGYPPNTNIKNNSYQQKDKKSGFRSRSKDPYELNPHIAFVNPYNFVPTQRPQQNIDSSSNSGSHTGYFSCRLITRTPLAILDVDEQRGNGSYTFMTVNGEKIIPGSSIRGVIRNIYETVTNSCMITLADDDVITARSDSRKAFKPGILIKETDESWQLYDAKRVPLILEDTFHKPMNRGGKDYKSFENSLAKGKNNAEWNGAIRIKNHTYRWGDKVWVDNTGKEYLKEFRNGKKFKAWECHAKDIQPWKNDKEKKPGYKLGYLFLGEHISNKHAESVFIKENPVPYPGKEKPNYIEKLDKIWDAYNDSAINRNLKDNHFGYQGYKEAKKEGVIPLWYQITDNNKIHLSFAAIGRMAYDNSLTDISNVGKPCQKRSNVCEACALFGMTGKDEKGNASLGSRVRFTDAMCITDKGIQQKILLKELASPKPSYLPFYTEGGKTYDDNGIKIRGRKFYWHNPKAASDSACYKGNSEDTSRSSTVDLQKSKSAYEFKVYFDGITDGQLCKLAWALTLGDNDENGKQCIKIGHGKPLGLGSAKVIIMDAIERKVDVISGNYEITPLDIASCISEGEIVVQKRPAYKSLLTITDYNAMTDRDVRYPYIDYDPKINPKENDVAAHQWFLKNKGTSKDDKPGLLPGINNANSKPLHPYTYKPWG